MRKITQTIVLLCLFAGIAACNPAESTDTPTLIPTEPLPGPTKEPSLEPTVTPTEFSPPPTEEPTIDPTSIASPMPEPTEASISPFDSSLTLYEPALRPAFMRDLLEYGPISRYRIELAVDPTEAELTGHQEVLFVNTDPVALDAVYFRLFPNLPSYGANMKVRNLLVEGVAVEGVLEAEDTALRVPLPVSLQPGEEVLISLDFNVTVPHSAGLGYGQFIYTEDVMALANFFPLIPAYDEENCARYGNCESGWNIEIAVPYGDAVFSDSALFEVLVTAPKGWTVAASGSAIAQESNPEGDVTWHLVGGPIRDFNLVLSPRYQVRSQTVEDIVVNSYYLPEDSAGGGRALRWSVDALTLFNQQFGPYPFAEFDVAATPTAAGGIEYPGLIVMPIRNYYQDGGFFELATVHEVAHQWWYSVVGSDQQDEPWLDEALTQYSTAIYFELHHGWDEAGEEMFGPWYDGVKGTPQDGAINLPVAAYSESTYGPLVYGKGPLFFHALRQELGDSVFFAILKTYFETYRYQNASGQQFLDLVEQISGQDLSALYQEWLDGVE